MYEITSIYSTICNVHSTVNTLLKVMEKVGTCVVTRSVFFYLPLQQIINSSQIVAVFLPQSYQSCHLILGLKKINILCSPSTRDYSTRG